MAILTEQRLDIVIFGATGFTGKHAINEVLKLAKEKSLVSWGIAGRNEKKLSSLLKNLADKTGDDLNDVKIIIADITREDTLQKMAKSARVIVNCTGPYRLYGEPVIKACLANGAHHVDISGEPYYMEKMQLLYHKEAEEKGLYIVSACGFDSIPVEMGLVFLQENFGGTINSVETYLETSVKGNYKGGMHFGTWESAVYEIDRANELRILRQQLFPNNLLQLKPKLKPRSLVHRSNIVEGWCVPNPGPDETVMIRSQYHFYVKEKKRPVQISTYVAFRSLMTLLSLAFIGAMLSLFARCRCGRALLLKYPGLFTLGYVSHEGPSEETQENTIFAVNLSAEGWDEKIPEPLIQFAQPTNKRMTMKVSGKNPAYSATCVMLLGCALMVLTESEKMPSKGGVYPPGAAFAKTSLVQYLNRNGVKFEVVS